MTNKYTNISCINNYTNLDCINKYTNINNINKNKCAGIWFADNSDLNISERSDAATHGQSRHLEVDHGTIRLEHAGHAVV